MIDMDTATLQEAVDYSVQQMVKQGGRCMQEGSCAYGNATGDHCAVGWLLDKDNEELMNKEGDVEDLCNDYPDSMPSLVKDNQELFLEIQRLHDTHRIDLHPTLLSSIARYNIDVSGVWFKEWTELRGLQV